MYGRARSIVFCLGFIALGVQVPSTSRPAVRWAAIPRVMLWAWERPEDLRGLDAEMGVAFLAQTIIVQQRFLVLPRRQPLRVSPGTVLIAVTRIETGLAGGLSLEPNQVDAIAAVIAKSADLPRVRGIQVDFDAVASERHFYRDLLGRLRRRLSPDVLLSITALASWCEGDRWLHGLPIDEAVPMLFRMGPVNGPFLRLAATADRSAPMCRGALGVSLDEPVAFRRGDRRVYVFSPKPWSEGAVREASMVMR
jgi:hypothetical protein